MKITIDRKWPKDTYTIGRLYVNGTYFCNTLEDTDRGLDSRMTEAQINKKKVYGETAIPKGTYLVDMNTVSPKYKAVSWYDNLCGGKMPRLKAVPGFSGILVHPGSTALDTKGCILVGKNSAVGKLTESRATFQWLYVKMSAAAKRGELITIEIK